MTYHRRSPDYTGLVARVASDFPVEWEAAKKRPDGSRDDRFIRRLAWEGHQRDPRIGLNGKRGGHEISTDALAFKNDSAPGGAEVIDVIVGSTHSPAWQDVTIAPGMRPDLPDGVLGRFIQPTDPSGSSSVPPATPGPSADLLLLLLEKVKALDARVLVAERIAERAHERIGKLRIVDAAGREQLGTGSSWGHAHTFTATIVER